MSFILRCVLALILSISASSVTSAAGVTVIDATGKAVTIDTPKRVVAIGGSLTEIVYAIGQQDRLIAVDSTSFYPPEATAKPNVGYMRALSPEGVLSLRPDLILALEGSGPASTMDILKSASVPIVIIPDDHSPQGIHQKIEMVARILGQEEAGRRLAATVDGSLASLKDRLSAVDRPRKVIFVMSLAGGRVLAAGSNTAADGIIRLAGGRNVMAGFDGYKQASDEAISKSEADLVLVMSAGAEPITADAVFALPAFATTPAAASRSFVSMDGLYLLGFGPRTAGAVAELAAKLYPDLATALGAAAK